MRAFLAALVLVVASSVNAFASEATDATQVVKDFFASLDKGDMKAAGAYYTASPVLIDEFPPHVWAGAGALDGWFKDFGTWAQAKKVTAPAMKFGKVAHADIDGDHAYLVMPGVFSFKENGKARKENGTITAGLTKADGKWRIAGWSWTRR